MLTSTALTPADGISPLPAPVTWISAADPLAAMLPELGKPKPLRVSIRSVGTIGTNWPAAGKSAGGVVSAPAVCEEAAISTPGINSANTTANDTVRFQRLDMQTPQNWFRKDGRSVHQPTSTPSWKELNSLPRDHGPS